MNNRKIDLEKWIPRVAFGLTALLTIILVGVVVYLDVLPIKFLVPIILGVVFLLASVYLLLFLPQVGVLKKIEKKKGYRIVGLVLAIIMSIVDIAGIVVVGQLWGTLSGVTFGGESQVIEHQICVYVAADNEAEELSEIDHCQFAYTTSYEWEYTEKGIQMIEDEIGDDLKLSEYETVVSMVDGLFSDEVEGFILSQSYMTVLENMEGYEDISSRVKVIYQVTVYEEISYEDVEEEIDITKDPFIVYISGNDTDYALTNVRNDVNILAVVNPSTKQVLLISTPRDSYVEIATADFKEKDKLTHCGVYGINCTIESLENLYGENIRYYTQINFKGFVRLIDALGGVSVESEKSFTSNDGKYSFAKGENYLSGDAALAFVRERDAFADGDFARGRNQMRVITSIVNKVCSTAILSNYGEVLDSMGACFGCNLREDEVSALVKMQLDDMATWNVVSYSVAGDGAMKYTYTIPDAKAYVIDLDDDSVAHARKLIDMVFDGKEITEEDLTY